VLQPGSTSRTAYRAWRFHELFGELERDHRPDAGELVAVDADLVADLDPGVGVFDLTGVVAVRE
jgi:hypothetical protein